MNHNAADLEAYLDEALPPEAMSEIEQALRSSPQLQQHLADILRRRDLGVHSLGEIWRRHRVSCPSREELGSYLLEALDVQHARYIEFHVETGGCRICAANLDDLRDQANAANQPANQQRRRNYFQSSVGYLRKHPT
jgi:tRNA U54 and U55 pseudouridine synthase Pus10